MTTLEGSSFYMQLKRGLCGRNSHHRSSLRKELLPSLVDVSAGAGSIIHRMTNLSIACILSSGIPVGACASVSKAPVSSGNQFQVVHAVFFPWATNADTVSHPVRAWNIGRSSDVCKKAWTEFCQGI